MSSKYHSPMQLPKLAEKLREMAANPHRGQPDRDVWAQAARCVEELARHEQQGGILMDCQHPVQCSYPDGDGGCIMCGLAKDLADNDAKLQLARRKLQTRRRQ